MCIRDRLKAGDLVLDIDGKAINDIQSLEGMLGKSKQAILTIMREGQTIRAVSYTHLDVYKRQHQRLSGF